MTKRILAMLTVALIWIVNAKAEESTDIQSANVAIAADIITNASPKTRSRCSETPCLGMSQAELGVAPIAVRDTPASQRALAYLVRFRLDGSLGEEFTCAVLRKGKTMRKWFVVLQALKHRERCVGDFEAVTHAYSSTLPPTEVDLVCRTTAEISAARREILEMLDSKRVCPF